MSLRQKNPKSTAGARRHRQNAARFKLLNLKELAIGGKISKGREKPRKVHRETSCLLASSHLDPTNSSVFSTSLSSEMMAEKKCPIHYVPSGVNFQIDPRKPTPIAITLPSGVHAMWWKSTM